MSLPESRKSLGQHFLTDTRVMGRIVDAAGITPEDRVLEIGPGPGTMTRRLAEQALSVTAIELDARLASRLEHDMPENVTVVRGDAVKVPWPTFDLQVSNLPYQVSSPVLFRLLDHPGWRTSVLLVQLEFAERLVAPVGSKTYGRLTVGCGLAADVELLERVPAGAFHPKPQVTSGVVRLTPRPPPFEVMDDRHLPLVKRVAMAAFTNRRKKLANGILAGAHLVGIPKATIASVLAEYPFREARPETLEVKEFGAIARALLEASEDSRA